MNQQQWRILSALPPAANALSDAGYTPILAAALQARGINAPQQAAHFLSIDETALCNPLLMKDMEKAVARVKRAVESGEHIAVYGDYDVDGITATALVSSFLEEQGANVRAYIPNRLEEGYGLNLDAIKTLIAEGVTLIITVDCGVTALSEAQYCKQHAVDLIITDHHTCKETLPDALAVINPHRDDCPYPFKGLSGVGVALKLCMAIAGEGLQDAVFARFSPLAAVGTVADVMPMTGENRVIVSAGMKHLREKPGAGMQALMKKAGITQSKLDTTAIGFFLAPRINAAGRMGNSEVALSLLKTTDEETAQQLAAALCDLNKQRQDTEADILSQCKSILETKPPQNAIVLSSQTWHQGVVGIVASRLCEQYHLPTFMVCISDGVGKGSCRTAGGINLVDLLSQCNDLLLGFGGHAQAAGFSVLEENLPALQARLSSLAPQFVQQQEQMLSIDACLSINELTAEGIASLSQLEPCGMENQRPVFMLSHVTIDSVSPVGQGRHLRLRLSCGGQKIAAIWFSVDEGTIAALHPGMRADVAFYAQINEFRGAHEVQLQILALRRAQSGDEVYRQYCGGKPLSQTQACCLLPARTLFVRLWKTIVLACKRAMPFITSISDLTEKVALGQIPCRVKVALDIMEEQGLITLQRQGETLSICAKDAGEKVDLNQSEIIKSLQAMQS